MTLFAYGTLLVPRIWRAVTRCDCPSEPATLPGYAIFRVLEADFPGIIESRPESSVPGRIFSGLDDEILARLDAYEDDFYERREVTLLDATGNPVQSQAYVVPARFREGLSDEPWTLDWFETEAMDSYLARHGF
ncbi:MAG: gamma-glutamylcyclotransferase [Verrucomicrobiae bacterium]|nr:gamma-glutamylcyclotransferase [Verrucomicrobiae bacterium]